MYNFFVKSVKYVGLFILIAMCFQFYSIGLDSLFYAIDDVDGNQAINKGYVEYFALFVIYYGIPVIAVILFFNMTVYVLYLRHYYWVQLYMAIALGAFIGYAIGDGNVSMYKGGFEVLKSVIVYSCLGATFIIIKRLFRL